MFFIRGFMKAPSSINCTSRVTVWHSRLYTILFFLMLLFLNVFRKVTYNLSSDTINYVDNFQTIFKGGIIDKTTISNGVPDDNQGYKKFI